ncbi:MAG: B12-binding domain-containing protein, partial [Desulfurococcaceae archaeon]|nr:B12-binding domain-containing protein [Desulfurococcaceae archaeon]
MKDVLLMKLKEAVINGDPEEVVRLVTEVIGLGVDLVEVIEKALVAGLVELGDRWVRGEVFIADLVAAADAMKIGLKILREELAKRGR